MAKGGHSKSSFGKSSFGKSSFGKSHGSSHIGHHSHHSHHHHGHHGRRNNIQNEGKIFQTQMDAISSTTTAPTLTNGILTIQGGQASVINHLNQRIASPQAIMYQPQPQMYPPPLQMYPPPLSMYQPPPGYPQEVQMMNMVPTPPIIVQQPYVTQANITVVGNKTASSDVCVFVLIILLGSFFIFPLLFLCCTCTKKMTYPKYDLSKDFYRTIGGFLRREGQCRILKLTVVDNCFNSQKARALYQSLLDTPLTGFTFLNRALECNYLAQEADDFRNNVTVIKSLQFSTSLTWGSQIL